MTKFLGMETGPTVSLSQHLTDVSSASRKLRAANRDYDELLDDYNNLVDRFNAERDAHKLTTAALRARNAQVTFIREKSPNSPAFALTTAAYRDGKKKTVARLFFEEAMKDEGRKLGVLLQRVLKFLDS